MKARLCLETYTLLNSKAFLLYIGAKLGDLSIQPYSIEKDLTETQLLLQRKQKHKSFWPVIKETIFKNNGRRISKGKVVDSLELSAFKLWIVVCISLKGLCTKILVRLTD